MNTSATGGFLTPTDTGTFLSDEQLEDFVQAWIVGLTGLDPTLVRPAYQEDPPPIPERHITWAAFFIRRGKRDWDPVKQHTPATAGADGSDSVFRNEELELSLTYYGPLAGDMAMLFAQGTGLPQNRSPLDAAKLKLVSVSDAVTVSEKIKGRYQRRIDQEVVLRRAVQFTYAVLDVLSATGELVSDQGNTTEINVGGFGQTGYGDEGYGA